MGIRTCFISGLALALLTTTGCISLTPTATETKSSLRPAIGEHTLENGLRIFTLEDHSAPLVTYEVWFKVGSGEERERPEGKDHGITGLSHFFEHMMFRGTPKNPKFFDSVYAMGGKLNAWTWLDATVYWEKIPSRHLPTIIEYEADRLENMQMDFLNLEPEREVVKSERLLRTENSAYGAMSEVMDATAFRTHPYHWPTVGWMRDLNAITLEEAREHHRNFYVPNNATVIVVGAFKTEEVLAQIEQAYGHLESRPLPPSERKPEPEQTKEYRDYVLKEVEASQAQIGYKVPPVSHPDFAVLEVLNQVLNGGKSSRLKKELVHGEVPRVSSLSSSLLPIRDPYLYLWNVKMLPGQTLELAVDAITRSIETLVVEGVSEKELTTAVNRLQASVIREMLNNQQRADMIGFGLITSENPYLYFDRLGEYAKVSAEDIQRAAKLYLTPERRTIITALSPERIESVARAWTETSQEKDAGGVLVEAIATAQASTDLEQKVLEAARERQAIALLQERAVTARAEAASAAEKAAIDKYMAENEKGDVTRLRNLEEEEKLQRQTREQLTAKSTELKASIDALGVGTSTTAKEMIALATLYMTPGTSDSPEVLTGKDVSAEAAVFYALWLESQGQFEAGADARRIALSKSENQTTEAARALAFDSVRSSVLPRAKTVGGQ